MQKVITQSLPTKLTNHIHVTGVNQTTVTITADNQNWANNLRYYQDQIVSDLNKSTEMESWKLKIRVQQNTATPEKGSIQNESEPAHSDLQTDERTRLRELLKRI